MVGGLVAALALLGVMALGAPRLDASVSFVITTKSILRIVAITGATALVAALLPALRLARVDPASVYRR